MIYSSGYHLAMFKEGSLRISSNKSLTLMASLLGLIPRLVVISTRKMLVDTNIAVYTHFCRIQSHIAS